MTGKVRLFALALVFCVTSAGAATIEESHITAALAKRVIVAVGGKLKDAESARYKLPKQLYESGSYCGCVNAKNSYGGYVGYKPFWLFVPADKSEPLISPIVDTDTDSVAGIMCKEKENYQLDC